MERLAVIVTLIIIMGCRSQQVVTWPRTEPLQQEESIRVWINSYDPISYIFENVDSLTLVIYTHRYKSNRLVQKKIYLGSALDEVFFEKYGLYNLENCSKYEGYNCQGLDGNSWKVEMVVENELISYEYWSPESQITTTLGALLINFKNDIESKFGITKHIEDFKMSLNKGEYWNFGESVYIR